MKSRRYSIKEIEENINGKKKRICYLNGREINCNNKKWLSAKNKIKSTNVLYRIFEKYILSSIQNINTRRPRQKIYLTQNVNKSKKRR